MSAFAEFFAMGGYAIYVWPAYGLTFALLLSNIVFPLQCERRQRQQLKARLRRVRQATQEMDS